MKLSVLLGVLIVFGLPAAAQNEGSKDFLKVPLSEAPSTSKWALVIGADGYENANALQVCQKDAKAFKRFLMDTLRFPESGIVLMTDDAADVRLRPTYTRLKRQMDIFLAGVDEDSEVVLFFSGHGTRANDKDWLVPLDGDPHNVPETCLNYNALRDALETRRPRRCVLITDACRNLLPGMSISSSGYGGSGTSELPQFAELRSCQPREVSQWLKDKSLSVFTHFLLQGWKGGARTDEGAVTFDALRRYVVGNTRQYVSQVWHERQNPDGRASFGDMVLARIAPPPPNPQTNPQPQPPQPQPAPLQPAPVPASLHAIEGLLRAANITTRDATAISGLGLAFYNRNDNINAEKLFHAAADLAPRTGLYQLNRASCLVNLNRWDEARAAARRALELGYRQPHWVYGYLDIKISG